MDGNAFEVLDRALDSSSVVPDYSKIKNLLEEKERVFQTKYEALKQVQIENELKRTII
jgi:hypothetical protein